MRSNAVKLRNTTKKNIAWAENKNSRCREIREALVSSITTLRKMVSDQGDSFCTDDMQAINSTVEGVELVIAVMDDSEKNRNAYIKTNDEYKAQAKIQINTLSISAGGSSEVEFTEVERIDFGDLSSSFGFED